MILLIRAIIHSYVHYTAHSFKQPPYCSFILSTILNYFPNVSIKLLIHSTNQFCPGFIFHIYCSLIQTTICQLLVFIQKKIYKTIHKNFSQIFVFCKISIVSPLILRFRLINSHSWLAILLLLPLRPDFYSLNRTFVS